jgi:hypothetical protein
MSELNISSIATRGGDKSFSKDQQRGEREEHGIVIGIVKTNSHPSRSGILNVFVPETGNTGTQSTGKLEDRPDQWKQVQWCSPFYSRTEAVGNGNNVLQTKNTAGFVYPSPDIGTRVLCFFPHGRLDAGFWFAAIPDTYMLQALPEVTASNNTIGSDALTRSNLAPALDYNDKQDTANKNKVQNFLNQTRPVDVFTASMLKTQGLDQDNIRGLSSSSYTRETPSEVIGLTSKGRRVDANFNDLTSSPTVKSALLGGGSIPDPDLLTMPKYRRKGHSFTIDDGDVDGKSNMIRLRTSKGHQILLDDTNGLLYLANSTGTAWVEMTAQGVTDVYSATSVTVRSRDINFHADNNIKFHAKNQMQFVADGSMHVEGGQLLNMYSNGAAFVYGGKGVDVKSGGNLNLEGSSSANLKGGSKVNIDGGCVSLGSGAATANKQNKATATSHSDTRPDGSGFWASTSTTTSTVDRLVTHEPFAGHGTISESTQSSISNFTDGNSAFIKQGSQPTVKNDGIVNVLSSFNNEKVEATSFIKQPTQGTAIGNLSVKAIDAVLTGVVEKTGSAFNYTNIEPITNAIGKYAFTATDLIAKGYVSPEVKFNTQLSSPAVWTGKNGISSQNDFLVNSFEQENLVLQKTVDVYQDLYNNGGIQKDDSQDFIGGMLSAAMGVGADIAKKFREGSNILPTDILQGQGSFDSNNLVNITKSLFQKGVSAVRQVEPVIEVPAGAKVFQGSYNQKTEKLMNINGKTYVIPIGGISV